MTTDTITRRTRQAAVYSRAGRLTVTVLAVFVWTLGTAAYAQELEWTAPPLPAFVDYPAEPYTGETHFARICSEKDWMFRTQLRWAAEQPPNFAGRFHLGTWGCGTDCHMGAAVDVSTGEVFWIPGTLSCAWCAEVEAEPFAFEPDSRLLILRGKLHRGGAGGEHYYVFADGSFIHLRTVPFD